MEPEYSHINHPNLGSLNITDCYLCEKPLTSSINLDHVIPDSMFLKDAANRPQLPVHKKCNSSKSLLDRRFKYRILLATQATNECANKEMDIFLAKVESEREDDFIIGKKVNNLRLAKTLSKGSSVKVPIILSPSMVVKIDAGIEHQKDITEFSKTMTRGLFIRNIPNVDPQDLELNFIDKVQLTPEKTELMDKTFYGLLGLSRKSSTRFMQAWTNIMYIGFINDENNSGSLWIEFYNTFVVTAYFETLSGVNVPE